MTASIVVGRRDSRRSCIVMGGLMALVFPGLGLLILPSIVFGRFQIGGLIWVAAWTLPAVAVWRSQREHRIEGDRLVSHDRRGERSRALSGVVELRPARWRFPAARVGFADGSAVWAHGRDTAPFLAVTLEHAPGARNLLPPGNWLRPRRLIWWAIAIVIGLAAE